MATQATDPPKKASRLQDIGFSKVTDTLHIYEPSSAPQASSSDPKTILFLAWMGATHRPVLRYLTYYRTLYPSARILVLFNNPPDFWRTTSAFQESLRPAFEALKTNTGPTLLHTFSNGGSYVLRNLVALNGGPLPGVRGAVIDSAPGLVHVSNLATPMATAMASNAVVRYALEGSILFFVAFYKIFLLVTGGKDSITESWEHFAGVESLPVDVKRTYIYSAKDVMVYADDVERNIAVVREKGVQVRAERYEDSKHVSHVMKDPERYWNAVRDLWKWSIE